MGTQNPIEYNCESVFNIIPQETDWRTLISKYLLHIQIDLHIVQNLFG